MTFPENPNYGDSIDFFRCSITHDCENILSGLRVSPPEKCIAYWHHNNLVSTLGTIDNPGHWSYVDNTIAPDEWNYLPVCKYTAYETMDDCKRAFKEEKEVYIKELDYMINRAKSVCIALGDLEQSISK